MANGKRRHDWDQTSSIMALTANCHRDTKERPKPFQPADFHPMPQPVRRKVVNDRLQGKEEFRVLKRVFVDQKG